MRSRARRRQAVVAILTAALAELPLAANAAEVCTALASGTWGPVSGGSVVWGCPGGAPSADDHFIVPGGMHVQVQADVIQTDAPGAGITVRAGGVLEALVSRDTGGITLGLGPAGLACQAGSQCSFRGGYRDFEAAEPGILTTFSESALLRVGDVTPCDGDDGQGAVADCEGEAAMPGDPRTVRFDYPAASGLAASFAALDAATDVVCFFLPDASAARSDYRSAELNQCFDLVAVSASDPPFLRLDVTQSVREQPGYPLARKSIHEARLTAPVATAGRAILLPAETVAADGELAARWLVFEGPGGRPLARPQRILRSFDGGAADDLFVIGDLRGAWEGHAVGERVWIGYGFVPGDPFVVLVPVHIASVTEDPDDTLLVTGDATLEMEAVWLDGVKRVDARGNGDNRFTRLWFRDPTPGQPGADLDLHAFHVDHRAATGGRFSFRQVNVTGGDERGPICGPAQDVPCVHDAVHWAQATNLLLEDVAARHLGNGCFPAHGSTKSSTGTTLVRLSCEFAVGGAFDGSIFDFQQGFESVSIRDVFCGGCGLDGDVIARGVGAGGTLTLEGLTLWGARSGWFVMPAQNVVSNLFVAGTRSNLPATLPARLDRFVHRENTFDLAATSAELFASNAEARNGVVRGLAVRTRYLARPGTSLVLENLAILDPSVSGAGQPILLGFYGAPSGAVLRRVLVWFTPGSQPLWTAGLELAADPVDFTLDGLLAVHARGAFGPFLKLGASAVSTTSFGAGPCFHDVQASVQPGTEGLYPATAVWDSPPGFVDEARGNLLPSPGGVADTAGCGLDAVDPPGLRGKRFTHWLTKTNPELVGIDGDGDGIPESAAAPVCAAGQREGCRDSCPGAFDPDQADADADGVGDACEAACRNGLDDDADGLADLADPGCTGADDESEEVLGQCADGLDNDRDGLADLGEDPGCDAAGDDLETGLEFPCDDGLDDDGDGLVDRADPGCASGLHPREDPECDDRFDNDGDGYVDFDDPQCTSASVGRERPARRCGLGFEAGAALAALYAWLLARGRARTTRASSDA